MASNTSQLGVTLVVRFDDIPKLVSTLPGEVSKVIRKYLHDVDADATAHAPVRTGYMKGSSHVDIKPGALSGRVHWTAEYAPFVNYGTIHMAARPFASNAAEKNRPGADAALASLAAGLGR